MNPWHLILVSLISLPLKPKYQIGVGWSAAEGQLSVVLEIRTVIGDGLCEENDSEGAAVQSPSDGV
jgi:hypothetical protein